MDPNSIENISRTMKRKGILLFRDALMEALDPSFDRRKCLVHIAHAAEILLKARIAQEHPLLIFSKIPNPNPNKSPLTFIYLLENGRTLSYEDLPDRLWAVTGFKIEGNILDEYKKFGKTRNQIIHTSMTSGEIPSDQIWRYSFEFLDPLVDKFWGHSVIEFMNDPESLNPYASLLEYKIKEIFPNDKRLSKLVAENCKKNDDGIDESWDEAEVQKYKEAEGEHHRVQMEAYKSSITDEMRNAQALEVAECFAKQEIREAKWAALLEDF